MRDFKKAAFKNLNDELDKNQKMINDNLIKINHTIIT
jgi:hypothetical protein